MSKNMVEPERPEMIIRRMRFVCWISKATRAQRQRLPAATYAHAHAHIHSHSHSECVILTDFPRQEWFHKYSSVLRHMHIVSLVNG